MEDSRPPIEPGCYVVLSCEVGEVESWGPRLTGAQSPSEAVKLLQLWKDIPRQDLEAARRLGSGRSVGRATGEFAAWANLARRTEGLVATDRLRAVLALDGALRRAQGVG